MKPIALSTWCVTLFPALFMTACDLTMTGYNPVPRAIPLAQNEIRPALPGYRQVPVASPVLPVNVPESSNEKPSDTMESQVLQELNSLRQNPRAFAERLRPRLAFFQGTNWVLPGTNINQITQEGAPAVREAIRYLESASPMPTLQYSEGLARAARDHAKDQSASGATGHVSARGAQLTDRLRRYGEWSGYCGENIDYGHDDPFEIVAALVVDDGVRDRGHRANLFSPNFRLVGIALATHPYYRHMCVMDYAGGFTGR